MKRTLLPGLIVMLVIVFSYCHTPRKATAPAKITYTNNIQSLVTTHCSPCHIPDKGGNKKPLNTYASASSTIDDMIHRIELNPGDRGFMPFKHPKLGDSTINVFKQWKADGLLEN
jgi:mono/diheme cytochrome c family protein